MRKWLALGLVLSSLGLFAQDVSITSGWKFKTGDDPQWAAPGLNDSSWAPIAVGKAWEEQGYAHYDGFAWYRLHIVIPSSIKEKAYLKEKIRFDLGKIDDGDEVYLNGSFLGRNAGIGPDIKKGPYDVQRSYVLPLNDVRIRWDKENVLAVRVWDGGGDGGMWDGNYGISVMDVTDYLVINASANDFQFGGNKKVSKKIVLQSISDHYDFNGKLRITITDPVSGDLVYKQSLGIDFARNRPFEYTWHAELPETKSYVATYSFEEERSKKIISFSEGIPYVLTPKPGSAPKINGPGAVGIRPGSPFQYRIAVSGQRPISYAVTGLPAGLHIDQNSGIITGRIGAAGTYSLKLSAKNKVGSSSKNLRILCGSTIGLSPALGWNSWNCWGLSVSDEKVRASAKTMSEKLADYGWTYINIDDGWQDKRNDQGEIIPNSKFPDMKALSDYVHSLGLKMGIYSSPGPLTCGGYMASYQHEDQDAATYGKWGIDYLKYDWCSYGKIAPQTPSLEDYQKPYRVMRAALDQSNRDILFSLCQYGMGDVWKWGAELGANSWRTTGDINDSWSSMSGIGFGQVACAPYTRPGHFNDPDMLVVGRVGWGPSLHNTRLTPDEQYTHISLWCLLSAPLLIGCDMSQLDEFTLNLLTNAEVLAVDQDMLAKPAQKLLDSAQIQVWVKELEDGSKALGIFNLSAKGQQPVLQFSTLKLPTRARLRDLWRQQELGSFTNSFSAPIPPHGVVLVKWKRAN
jgi:alpha-galactosidase